MPLACVKVDSAQSLSNAIDLTQQTATSTVKSLIKDVKCIRRHVTTQILEKLHVEATVNVVGKTVSQDGHLTVGARVMKKLDVIKIALK